MSRSRTSNKGVLFVVSAPSGAGKTTVVDHVLKKDKKLRKTISHTTRPPRPEERDGRDYYFVSAETFSRMIARGEFVEWAKIYGQFYGTSKKTLKEGLARGRDMILVIESQGARSIKKKFKGAVFVLMLPPSVEELKRRILLRRGMPLTLVLRRLKSAQKEVQAMKWYDYVVVNDQLSKAVAQVGAIVQAERLKCCRQRVPLQIT